MRDPRLAWFATDGLQDPPAPTGRLALLADELSGPQRHCPGATDNELTGLLRTWAAIESWVSGAKLGVIREMMRREGAPSPGGDHGGLPEAWSPSLRYELAAALACSTQSAETTAWLAWEQQARLPGIGALLDGGILTHGKARAVVDTFRYLTDSDAGTAEALILDQLPGKTYTQVLRLAEQAALTVDPELAKRRREQAQRKDARVSFFREAAGTAALSGRDLPPDEALAAMASVNARAGIYRESDAFGDTRMDVLRAYAYLDLLKDVPAEVRTACAEAQDEAAEAAEALAWAEARAAAGTAARTTSGTRGGDGAKAENETSVQDDTGDDDDQSGGDSPDSDGPTGGGPGPGRPGPGRPGPSGPGPSSGPDANRAVRVSERRPADLVVPLATLLGRAERPGEIQGFGLVDPALARELAAAAAASPRTEVCVTVTSPEGYAIGHGCARACRVRRENRGPATDAALAELPARLNLTVPAAALGALANQVGPWAFLPRGSPDLPQSPFPPDGYGSWTLTLPGGRRFAVRLDLVPTFECDHRYETHGYQPGDKLRHLVQVRDGTCTFPSCDRHARNSDFEHATPYDKGGKTCTCNAGARSRACHRVKQSPGWSVTQPKPGWHQWETPSGRVYLQEPKRYTF
ncbi:MAG TPA: hypothetical protein VGD91_07865 [Trebonia sp.]